MTLEQIVARRAELKTEVATRSAELSNERIDEISKELDSLEVEERGILAKQELDKRMANLATNSKVVETANKIEENEGQKRGKLYKAKLGTEVKLRAATAIEGTTGQGILIPSHSSPIVTPFPWNEVSSIVDLVDFIDLPNGSEYTQSFQISTGEGDYTLEPTKTGADAVDQDGLYNKVTTAFDQVTIKRNKITAIDYMSEELDLLPEANYAGLVEANIGISLKKKLAKEIILGDGKANHFVGLAATDVSNLNANTYTDLSLGVDENTLTEALVEFGGQENIEGKQVLVMNKKSIKNFAKVRGANKEKVYNIQITGNTFTIDGYRGVFTSHLKPFDLAAEGEIWAVYADMSQYKALNFGGEVIETSKEFKFNQGITAIRGKVFAGGGMAGYKAFLRLKKPAEVSRTASTSK